MTLSSTIVVFDIQGKDAFNEYNKMIFKVAYSVNSIWDKKLVKPEFWGAYGGEDEYADQSITVGKNSMSGALNINGIWTDEGGKYTHEKEGDQLHIFWAYIYKGDARIGFFLSATRASDNASLLQIGLGKGAIEYASIHKRDFSGIQINTTGYDTTWNWSGFGK